MVRTRVGRIPEYRGLEWIGAALPTQRERWPKFGSRALIDSVGDDYDMAREEVSRFMSGKPWVWPDETIYFFSDIHADADALFASIVASGGVAKTGPRDTDFELTEVGREATFVFGGDYFDKGPCNLRLFRALRSLVDSGARVELLAGNHDVRALVGLTYAGRKETLYSHLFVRMGKKAVPLFREIWDGYLEGVVDPDTLPSKQEVRDELWPRDSWYDEFPEAAKLYVTERKLEKEIRRIREKSEELADNAAARGMTLGMVRAAFHKARELFLQPDGEFRWIFDRMQLARRAGSFLFIHAGVDDEIAGLIRSQGIDGLNTRFRRMMEEELFELYHGPTGNTFRTKYRDYDLPFTERGVTDMHCAGIYAIVHGHQSITRGQRIRLRHGLLNFECDASVDCNTRARVGLEGPGGASLIIRPDGSLLGISTDYPYAKLFEAAAILDTMAIL